MIFQAELANEQGELVLRATPTWEQRLFNLIYNVFLIGVGGLAIYVFVSGGGPKPSGDLGVKSFLGWMFVGAGFTALGLAPFARGMAGLLLRESFSFNSDQYVTSKTLLVNTFPVWRKQYCLSEFDRIKVNRQMIGVFGKQPFFVIVCTGSETCLPICASSDSESAKAIANAISARTRLPVMVT